VLVQHEIVMVQKLTEMIFPGAIEARVPTFIVRDMQSNPFIVNIYKEGLGQLGQAAKELFNKKLVDLEDDELNSLVIKFEEEPFFTFLRNHTIEGMFSDPIYGGNYQAYGWRLVGFAGPRFYPPETLKEPKHPTVYYSLEGLAYDEKS
jgi:hypothetical protein